MYVRVTYYSMKYHEEHNMARGGINKALVIEARQNLIARAENPSIDAVRVELGNTGSKSTIHRYLKEIESSESSKLSDEALLSQPIRELVSRLATQLKDESDELIAKAKSDAGLRIEQLERDLAIKNQESESYAKRLTESDSRTEKLSSELQALNVDNDKLTMQLTLSAEEQSRLSAVIEEKQNQIDSLEEKHIHSREALDSLNETISVKQSDITQLNKDNARLVTELTTTRRKANDMETKAISNGNKLEQLKIENTTLGGALKNAQNAEERLSSELEESNQKVEEARALNSSLSVEHAKLESEAEVKTEMLAKLLSEK